MPLGVKMPESRQHGVLPARRRTSVRVTLSYVLDWIVLVAVGVVAVVTSTLEPRKRPFALADASISFPYTNSETIPLWLLAVLVGAFPLITILIATLVLVPGPTAPRRTPASITWRLKLWQFHAGILGFVTAQVLAFAFTQGMKNIFGRPRPDFVHRCQPDLDNAEHHIVGGYAGAHVVAQLYSASICLQKDMDLLDDGFRSFPSGHSSASAAGLVYLSLFLAAKLIVGFPSYAPNDAASKATPPVAFPSRTSSSDPLQDGLEASKPCSQDGLNRTSGLGNETDSPLHAVRNQAAAAPLYLLVVALAPLALSMYISASRWFDFRHHAFDVLFGYFIGAVGAVLSFRSYHLPIAGGGGWAWGPRCESRAFWAGVGRIRYTNEVRTGATAAATTKEKGGTRDGTGSEADDKGSQASLCRGHGTGAASGVGLHGPQADGNLNEYFDVEMQSMNTRYQ